MVDIPPREIPAWKQIQDSIPKTELAKDGIEDHCHITVKFGLHDSSPDKVRKVIRDFGPISLTFGGTSLFTSDMHDVLIVEVDSDDLHRLNALIKKSVKCTDTFPVYKPHLTIAYLKPGKGKKYKGRDDFAGISCTVDKVEFSSKDRQKYTLPINE